MFVVLLTGAVNINVTGGTSPFSYNWSNGSTDEDLMNVASGLYSVTVTDANGCTETQSETVIASSGTLEIASASITHENCGNGNGSININVNGGTAPVTYQWSNGAVTEDISNLSAGVYYVTVTDGNSCDVTMTYTIDNDASDLYFSHNLTNEICSNGLGSIDVYPGGGDGSYTYLWSNGATSSSINTLSTGDYSCTITDGTGCSISTGIISVGNTSNAMISSEVITDANCSGNGSVDVTVVGGSAPITYLWDSGETTEDISNVSAGVYIYTITDGNGCQIVKTIEVQELNGNINYASSTSNENCNDGQGSIDLSATSDQGPLTFAWSNGETTEDISGLSAGTYTCVISDPNGCSVTTNTIQISSNPGSLSIDNLITTDETCNNGLGSIDISVTGGLAPTTYLWSNGETTEDISNLATGTYSVTVTDGNGCQTTAQDVVQSSSGSLAITSPIVQNENCNNNQGSIDITLVGAANPITYDWSNGATTEDLTGLSEGVYYVTVTDGNGCSVIETYTVGNSGSNLEIASSSISDEYCNSGSGSIVINVANGTAPYSYLWSNGSTSSSISNLTQGSYTVTVTDGGGCSISQSFTVNNNNGNLLVNGTVTDETCGQGDGLVDVVTTGGNMPITYTWDNGSTTEDLNPISAGLYVLTATDNFGCQSIYTAMVDNNASDLAIVQDVLTNENCAQGDGEIQTTISGTNIVSTVWSSGETTDDISGLSAGDYTLTITNDQGCSLSETYTIQNLTGGLAISFTNTGNETCSNGQGFIDIEVAGTGPYTYAWNDGQTTQDAIGLTAGVYTVTVTDGAGCSTIQTFEILNDNATNISATENITSPMCTSANGAIDITVSGGISPYTFAWNNGETTEDLSNVTSGTYSVTIYDAMSCESIHTVQVTATETGLGFTQIDINNEFCGQGDGDATIFSGGTADDYYVDGVNNGGWLIDNLSAGTYTLSISDNAGCWVDSVITIGSDAMFNVTGTTINETCANDNGSIDITVTQGGPGGNVDFLWSNGETTEDISGLDAGSYSVTVTSTQGPGCSVTYDFVVDETATFLVTESIVNDNCNQSTGSIDLTVSDPANIVYDWSTGEITATISGLSEGTYSCVVTNTVTNCSQTLSYTVINVSNGMYSSSIPTNELCNDQTGAIDLIPGGGSGSFTYSWSNSESTEDISNLSAGSYTVTITDQADNCMITETIVISNDADIFGGTGVVTDATCIGCFDGGIDVTFTSPISSYNWSNGETTEDLSNLDPGTYTLEAVSPNGCDTSIVFIVQNTAGLFDVEFGQASMSVSPNPANENFSVIISNPNNEKGILKITNALGQEIKNFGVQSDKDIQLNAKEFVNGMYFVIFEFNNHQIVERLIISNE